MQPINPVHSASPNGHSRIMQMMLHLSLEGGGQSQIWPERGTIAFDRTTPAIWTRDGDPTDWPPRTRLAVLALASLASWTVVLGLSYLLWQAF